MSDTVVWKIDREQYSLINESAFDGESSKGLRGRYATASVFVNKYAKEQRDKGRYFPLIEIKKDKEGAFGTLEIQASLPRQHYGCSIFEVDEEQLESLCTETISCLGEVNILTSREQLEKAIIKRADFCKNITIPSYFGTAKQIIRKLAVFDYKRSSSFKYWEILDNEEGVKIKFHNTSRGYVIYDKTAEIVCNGYTELEKKIIENIKQNKIENNIVRFELSFYKQASFEACVRKHLKVKTKHFTLRDILKKDLAKNMLMEAFNEVYQSSFIHTITLAEMKENELENFLRSKNLAIQDLAFILFWLNKTIKIGIQETLRELRSKASKSKYDRDKKRIEKLLEEFNKSERIIGYTASITGYLKSEHEQFKIMKPSHL